MKMRTQVGIVGAGPAGLLLAHLLHRAGIESVVLESRDRDYVEHRVRAGVLEQGAVDVLTEAGVADRLHREGMRHHGVELRFGGRGHRIDFAELTPGRSIFVYGQQEVVKDLIEARLAYAGPLLFDVSDVAVRDVDSRAPTITFKHGGEQVELACDVVAGCDGFHGICRQAIPGSVLSVFERVYPFAWLGILAKAPPTHDELIYAYHERGFALYSMRSPEITRLYVQVAPEEDIGELAGCADLGGTARAPRDRRRLEADRGTGPREGHHGHAELRRGADAARPPVPGRRRRAHRAADGREGHEPRRRRRAHARARADRVLRDGSRGRARRVLADVPARASGAPSTSRGG